MAESQKVLEARKSLRWVAEVSLKTKVLLRGL